VTEPETVHVDEVMVRPAQQLQMPVMNLPASRLREGYCFRAKAVTGSARPFTVSTRFSAL
jgi:hypothetical protein